MTYVFLNFLSFKLLLRKLGFLKLYIKRMDRSCKRTYFEPVLEILNQCKWSLFSQFDICCVGVIFIS